MSLNRLSLASRPNNRNGHKPQLEILEDRFVPASFSQLHGASGLYETKSTALDLGILTKDVDRTDLKLDGQADWIKFKTRETGGVKDRIFLSSDNGGALLQLQLFNENGTLIGSAGGRSVDFTSVKFTGIPPGYYFAKVTGINHATGIHYRLHVDAPVVIGNQNDKFENNNSQSKATDLGLILPETNLKLNANLPKNDEDWYSLRFSRRLYKVSGANTQVIVTAPQGWANNWHLEVYDGSDNLVGLSSGASATHGVTLASILPGKYKFHVYSDGNRGIGSYKINVPPNIWASNDIFAVSNSSVTMPHLVSNTSIALPNSQLNTLVSQLIADGQLSREDWIGAGGIFDTIENDGSVNSSEFASMQVLLRNASILDMPSQSFGNGTVPMYGYVYNLANKVVNGDYANATYQGQSLGNLASGSTANQLELLVDKWFLGMDHPDAGHNYSYVEANGNPLFGPNGPLMTDINQGNDGDCFYLSSLGSILSKQLAGSNPNYIGVYNPATGDNPSGFFINNNDGTYTVRFYYQSQTTGSWVPDYVTVDQFFPTTLTGNKIQWVYANAYADFSNTSTPLWVAMMEKAYVQENASARWSPSTTPSDVTNNYQTISGLYDGNQALMQLSGQNGYLNVTNLMNLTFQQIVNAYTNGVGVVFGTMTKPLVDLTGGSVSNDTPLVTSHDYMMYGYNASNQTILLQNPWGSPYYGTYNSINPSQNTNMTYLLLEATVSFIQENFDGYYAVNPLVVPTVV